MAEMEQTEVGATRNGTPSINTELIPIGKGKCPTVVARRKCIRNLLIISFSYFLYFTGYWSLMNLQSTMNAEQGMGPESQALMNFCSIFSCFLPTVLIGKLGAQKTFLLTIALSCTYIAANIYLNWILMLTTAAIYGLSAGPLNSALSMYIDEMAFRYEAAGGGKREKVQSLFFGIYAVFAQSTVILGNSLSSVVIKDRNLTQNSESNYSCGINFDAQSGNETNQNLTPPTDDQRFLLIGIYIALAILGVVFAALIEPLKNDTKDVSGLKSIIESFVVTVKHLKNKDQLFLIIISIYAGMEGPFYSNVYTEAYIGCSWGIHHVGMVSVCYGVCGALISMSVGQIVKCTSLMFALVLAATGHMIAYVCLFVWNPSPLVPSLYYVFAGLFGMGDALWWSQLPALYGLKFPEEREVAFSNLYFCCYIGHFTTYFSANYLSVEVKLFTVTIALGSGMICCITGQILKKANRKAYVAIPGYSIDDVS